MQDALHGERAAIPTRRRPSNGINYIRNSVKATVDAFHGTVRFYLIDDADPVALTLPQRVPGSVPCRSPRCPRTCGRGCAIPKGIFAMQAAMYATYHMTNPSVFYNKEDLWEVPAIDDAARSRS